MWLLCKDSVRVNKKQEIFPFLTLCKTKTH